MAQNLSIALSALKNEVDGNTLAAIEVAYREGLMLHPDCPLCSRLAAHRAIAKMLSSAYPAHPAAMKYVAIVNSVFNQK